MLKKFKEEVREHLQSPNENYDKVVGKVF